MRDCLHQINLWAFSRLLISKRGSSPLWAAPTELCKKVADCESGSEPISSHPLWPLLQLLPPGPRLSSYPSFPQGWTATPKLKERNPFLCKLLLVTVFTATESKLEHSLHMCT